MRMGDLDKWDAMIIAVLVASIVQPLRILNPFLYWGIVMLFLWVAIYRLMNKHGR